MCSNLIMDGTEVVQCTKLGQQHLTTVSCQESPLSSPSTSRSYCNSPSDISMTHNNGTTMDDDDDGDISVGCPSPALSCSPATMQDFSHTRASRLTFQQQESRDSSTASSSCFSSSNSVRTTLAENEREGGEASDDEKPRTISDDTVDEEDYFKPLKRLKMIQLNKSENSIPHKHTQQLQVVAHAIPARQTSNHTSGVKSFSILDILNHRPRTNGSATERAVSEPNAASARIVRPWDLDSSENAVDSFQHHRHHHRPKSADLCYVSETLSPTCSSGRSSTAGSVASDCCTSPDIASPTTSQQARHTHGHRLFQTTRPNPAAAKASSAVGGKNTSPLDALFQMTSKTFEELNGEAVTDGHSNHLNLFNNRQQAKKKRKSRTAFTNHQVFELEKRFLYQKYLSPADRDEIASQLGLGNAQVITWFQNRRAKLKRDMEELKNGV
ncbi:uncharacterized protein [Anabrus simplex]|uniref:uncharacterized protein isoform X2 n=1 Tax=Anabrus simplex TaxID=316456 RepID=UPI0035A342FF